MLRPFYRLAKMVELIPTGIRQMVTEKAPKACAFLLAKKELDEVSGERAIQLKMINQYLFKTVKFMQN